jgi:hypothetical protein
MQQTELINGYSLCWMQKRDDVTWMKHTLGYENGTSILLPWIIDGQSMISGDCEVWIFSELMEQHCILIIVMQWSIWVTPGMVNSCWIYVKKNHGTEGNLFYLVGFRFWDKSRVKLDYRPVHMNTLDDEVEPFPPKARVYWELQLCLTKLEVWLLVQVSLTAGSLQEQIEHGYVEAGHLNR